MARNAVRLAKKDEFSYENLVHYTKFRPKTESFPHPLCTPVFRMQKVLKNPKKLFLNNFQQPQHIVLHVTKKYKSLVLTS